MNIVWIENNEPITFDCKHYKLKPSRIRNGDFVLYQGELLKVETIQRDCPRIENLNYKFTQFTFRARDGRLVPCSDLFGPRDVYRAQNNRLAGNLR